jgi:hypothetical protein
MPSRRLSGLIAVLTLASTFVLMAPSPASAACATYPGTNEIRISFDPPLDQFFSDIVVPGTPSGLVQVCVDVSGTLNPQASIPTADTPSGCGIPCFYVSWDGVSNDPMTVSVSVTAGDVTVSKTATIPGGAKGGFCIKAGTTCP